MRAFYVNAMCDWLFETVELSTRINSPVTELLPSKTMDLAAPRCYPWMPWIWQHGGVTLECHRSGIAKALPLKAMDLASINELPSKAMDLRLPRHYPQMPWIWHCQGVTLEGHGFGSTNALPLNVMDLASLTSYYQNDTLCVCDPTPMALIVFQ